MKRSMLAAGVSLTALVAGLVVPQVAHAGQRNADPSTAPAARTVQAPNASHHRLPPLKECATPSIDRLQHWLATGEGTTVPATGSLLVPVRRGYDAESTDGHHQGSRHRRYAAKVTFVNAEWHVVVVWLANQFEAQVDLSASSGFWLTYRATEDLYVQLRPASRWSGGDKWLTLIPSTEGRLVRRFFSFSPDAWTTLPELGAPSYPFAEALREARGFVFVGKTANTLDFRGLRIHGYVPPCL